MYSLQRLYKQRTLQKICLNTKDFTSLSQHDLSAQTWGLDKIIYEHISLGLLWKTTRPVDVCVVCSVLCMLKCMSICVIFGLWSNWSGGDLSGKPEKIK